MVEMNIAFITGLSLQDVVNIREDEVVQLLQCFKSVTLHGDLCFHYLNEAIGDFCHRYSDDAFYHHNNLLFSASCHLDEGAFNAVKCTTNDSDACTLVQVDLVGRKEG